MHFFVPSILSLSTIISTSNALATRTRDPEHPGSYDAQVDANHNGYLSPNEIKNAADLSKIYETHFKNAEKMDDVNLTIVIEDYYQIPWSEKGMNKLAAVASTLQSGQMLSRRSLDKRCSTARCAEVCKKVFLVFTICFLTCLPISGPDCDK